MLSISLKQLSRKSSEKYDLQTAVLQMIFFAAFSIRLRQKAVLHMEYFYPNALPIPLFAICQSGAYTANHMIIVKETETPTMPAEKITSKKSEIKELIWFICIAIVCVLPIRLFIAQPFIVKGHSMYPTFQDKDYLIVNELTTYFENPTRDEVIVFKHPNPPHQYLIKRVIGLPGETVQLRHGTVTIINAENPKGFVLPEPYIREPFDTSISVTLAENEYFVMGDNRNQSSDSRSWGVLPQKNIVGTPLVRLLPTKHIGLHPGKYSAAK